MSLPEIEAYIEQKIPVGQITPELLAPVPVLAREASAADDEDEDDGSIATNPPPSDKDEAARKRRRRPRRAGSRSGAPAPSTPAG
jgi:ATP-dependent RNA helicase RhlB